MTSTPNADSAILAFDIGTSGLKAVLADARGTILDRESEPYGVLLLEGGGAEQDPADWWRAMVAATRRLLGRGVVAPAAVRTLCVSAQWSGTVAVGADGEPLMNAVIWMDSRGAPALERVTGGLVRVEGFGVRRLLRWLRTTGGAPGRAGKDPLAHILYIKDALPEIYRRTAKFLEPKDYLNLKLTGRAAATFDSITLHWLTNNRDIAKVRYDDGLLSLTGIERAKLPDLCRATDILGTVREKEAAELGISPEAQVVAGIPDLHAATIGSGAVRDFEGHVYIGTSAWIFCHVPFQKTDVFHSLGSFPASIPGRYMILDEQECAGSCLTWLKDNLFFRDDALKTAPPPDKVWAAMDRLVEQAPVGSGNVLFAPWLFGERTPVEDHTLRGGFFNVSLNVDRAHLVRAVYEGIAFNLRWLLGHVEKLCGRPFDKLNFIGGGARSDVWCQILADVMNRPIAQMEDPVSANARGTAFLAAVATGALTWDEIPSMVAVRQLWTPRPEHRATYDRLFKEYLAIYEATHPICRRLNAPGSTRP